MNQRQGFAIIISEEARKRIDENKCPSCGLPKSKWKRRKNWRCCSTLCTKWFEMQQITYGWPDVCQRALERDNFTCKHCLKSREKEPFLRLEGDHILAIALGGKEFDIENVQTLCYDCHKVKTKEDMKKISELRRKEKIV